MTADIKDSPLAHFTSLFINICQVSWPFIEKKKCLLSNLFWQSLSHDCIHIGFNHRCDSRKKKTMALTLVLVSVLHRHQGEIIIMGTYFLEAECGSGKRLHGPKPTLFLPEP